MPGQSERQIKKLLRSGPALFATYNILVLRTSFEGGIFRFIRDRKKNSFSSAIGKSSFLLRVIGKLS